MGNRSYPEGEKDMCQEISAIIKRSKQATTPLDIFQRYYAEEESSGHGEIPSIYPYTQ
jgi:hypothetical protein